MNTLIIITYASDHELNLIYKYANSVLYTVSDYENKTHKIISVVDDTQLSELLENNLTVSRVKSDPDTSKFTVYFHPDPNAREEIATYGKVTVLFDNYTLVEQLPKDQVQPPDQTRYIYYETPLADQVQDLPNPLTIQEERFQFNQQGNVSLFAKSDLVPSPQHTPILTTTISPISNTPLSLQSIKTEKFFTSFVVVFVLIVLILFFFLIRKITKNINL